MSTLEKISSVILIGLLGLLLLAAGYSLQGADVTYDIRDFTTSTNLRKAVITPISTPAISGSYIIQSDRLTFTNITDGAFTVTNMIGPVTYRVELIGPFTTTTFTNLIPDTNVTINAKDYISSTISPGATVGYSQTTANARFVLVTNGGAVNLTITNAATILGNLSVASNLTVSGTTDILGYPRFQFDNRASTTVSAGTDTTYTNATASGSITIPANFLIAGTVIEVEASGATFSMAGGPLLTNKFKLSGSAIATGTATVEGDGAWYWKSTTTIRTAGASGTFVSGGLFTHDSSSATTYPRGSGSIDTTTAKTIDFTGAIQAFSAESSICSNLVVRITRP